MFASETTSNQKFVGMLTKSGPSTAKQKQTNTHLKLHELYNLLHVFIHTDTVTNCILFQETFDNILEKGTSCINT